MTENEGLRMLLSKAQAIDELESSIPGWGAQGERALQGCPSECKLHGEALHRAILSWTL